MVRASFPFLPTVQCREVALFQRSQQNFPLQTYTEFLEKTSKGAKREAGTVKCTKQFVLKSSFSMLGINKVYRDRTGGQRDERVAKADFLFSSERGKGNGLTSDVAEGLTLEYEQK